jgi:coenzyme F420-reducing hydrogenase delta subunit/thioredoxin reductase/NAD-dependent dihydropyrimidine dehydrogenase PreA subunit
MAAQEVLIVGGGFAGLTTACALAGSGMASTVIESGGEFGGKLLQIGWLRQTGAPARDAIADLLNKAGSSGRVDLLEDTRLAAVTGTPGDFACSLEKGGSVQTRRFGAVVLATGSTVRTPEGLAPLETIYDLPSDMSCVCIVMAPGDSSSPAQAEAALGGARNLRDKGVEVVVLYRQMKVAGAGLQSLYDEARASGVVFNRYTEFPAVSKSNGGFQVDFTVEDLGERVRMYCDTVLAEGREIPSSSAGEIAAILDIDTDTAGFFQSENISLYPVSTRRRGVFAVGSCRKPVTLEEVVSDASCAAAQIREMFALLQEGPPVDAPVVDTEKCAFCLTCYRACPHRAIGFDFENRAAKILENACFACGVCVVECPARAIKFEAEKSRENPPGAKIVAFFCRHSATEALDKLKERNLEIPEMTIKEVPCSGRIEIPHLLEAFEQGADGVLIAGCHRGSCRSLTGSHYAWQRSERVKIIMGQIGLQPDKLEMLFVSDIEPVELSRALCSFAKRLESIPVGE